MADTDMPSRGNNIRHDSVSYAETHHHKLGSHFIGGNKLKSAPDSKVKDFVAAHDGHTVITKVARSSISLFVARIDLTDSHCE